MIAFWAIVLDTWRQSRQQTVFIIMLGLLLITAIGAIVVPSPHEQPDGTTRIGVVFDDEPAPALEAAWIDIYAQTLMLKAEEKINPFDEDQIDQMAERHQAALEAAEAQANTPLDRRAVEVILFTVAGMIFTLSMLLFLAASSGYMPAMLESGAIDIVLAKPIDRLRIYLGKYAGGLALYSAAIGLTYFIIFVGVGFRTGVWVERIFLVMPLQILAAAVLYAIIGALGVVSRSATLCLVVGLLFYLVVDSIVASLIQVKQFGLLADWPWVERVGEAMRLTLPNFAILKANATASLLNIPLMEWQPFLVAFVWMILCVGFGYWRFSRADY